MENRDRFGQMLFLLESADTHKIDVGDSWYEIIVEALRIAENSADAVDTEKQELIGLLKEFVTWADLARESIGLVVENNTNSMVNRANEILAKHGGQL
jgi:hypothetical protein